MRLTGRALAPAVIPAVVCGLCAAGPHPAGAATGPAAGPAVAAAHPAAHRAPPLTGDPAAGGLAAGNPMAANHSFGVVTRRDALLAGTGAGSAVAVGGDLSIGSRYTVTTPATGGFVAPGDARPTALLVDGAVDLASSAADGVLRVAGDGYVKVGDPAGSATRATGMDGSPVKTRVVAAGAGYDTAPRVELTTAQPSSSVAPARGLVDFGTLFAGHRRRADALARCPGTVRPADPSGPGATARIRLADARTNVLRLTGTRLVDLRTLDFGNRPTATRPLVIVVDTTAENGELSWRTPAMTGVTAADAPYILWAFADATDLTLTAGGATLRGSLYAPRADLTDRNPANIEGDVVVRSLKADPHAGALHHAPFAAEPRCGTRPAPRPAPLPDAGPAGAAEPARAPEAGLRHAPGPEAEPPKASEGEPPSAPEAADPEAADPEAGPAAPDPVVPPAVTEARPAPDAPAPGTPDAPAAPAAPAAPSVTDPSPDAATGMAETGSRARLWLLGAGAALLVATGTVLTRASRRHRQDPGE
ncbi:collagen-binding domain-containing protein [Streptomyces ficellus]|uniref:Choice-of-anchor A family protein n=1 Tax=Streptomyces ficellus TaxID=1977088 RepID=A0A6I6FR26_9ACTN|nr:collagen-binding domain-containing protein [Streptomyces ficellus]QGV82125.1 choice-of-anchor A family protein [Streptomyces ficellus]